MTAKVTIIQPPEGSKGFCAGGYIPQDNLFMREIEEAHKAAGHSVTFGKPMKWGRGWTS